MKSVGRLAKKAHQRRQALDVLAVDLDQLEASGDGRLPVDRGMRGLDQRRLAHAARAPEQRVVGRQAVGEALGVLDQEIAHPVDAAQKRKIDAVDASRPAPASRAPPARRRPRPRRSPAPPDRAGASRSRASAMRLRRSAWLWRDGIDRSATFRAPFRTSCRRTCRREQDDDRRDDVMFRLPVVQGERGVVRIVGLAAAHGRPLA